MAFPTNQPFFLIWNFMHCFGPESGTVTCLDVDSAIICIGDCSPTCSDDCVVHGYNGGACLCAFSSFSDLTGIRYLANRSDLAESS
ncbi:hypothetical protein GmHk_18G052331 [Glycine max]|nr:hypothetical protein GmHk_18G052331 [Glycine max]